MTSAVRWVVLVVLLTGVAAGLYYWQQSREQPEPSQPAPEQPAPLQRGPIVGAPTAPEASAEPRIRYPIEAAQSQPGEKAKPLPALDKSDGVMREAVTGLYGAKDFSRFFYGDDIIHRIVVTIDNLPREKVPVRLRPLKSVPGLFAATGGDESAVIATDNPARYAPYVRLAEAVDEKKLVALYVRFYPLFQRAYEDLGYPKGYFNDRLVEVIDHLLAAPDVKQPIKLVRPKVMYQFSDPELEALSAGQKTLIRMGGENARKIKAKLQEIRHELTGQVSQR
jgi:hypothetical protein